MMSYHEVLSLDLLIILIIIKKKFIWPGITGLPLQVLAISSDEMSGCSNKTLRNRLDLRKLKYIKKREN